MLRSLFGKHPRIYLLGAYGYGNIGDEACRVVATEEIKRMFPEVKIEAHHGMLRPIVKRGKCRINTKRYIACVAGGGGFLYDYVTPANDNLGYYLGAMKKFIDADKPVYLIGVGTQGKFTTRGQRLIKKVLDRCDLITVRSNEAKFDLIKCGVKKEIWNSADLAFLLEPDKIDRSSEPFLNSETSQKIGIGISVDTLGDSVRVYHPGFNEKIPPLLKKLGLKYKLLFYVFDPRFDLNFAKGGLLIKDTDPKKFLYKVKFVDGMISTRYHGLVFSLLRGIPCISIADHGDKKHRLIKRIGYPWMIRYDEISSEKILDKIHQIFHEKYNQPWVQWKRELQKSARISFDLLREMLEKWL